MKTLSEAIRTLAATHNELYSVIGIVKEIDTDAMTCTVAIEGEADVHGVKITVQGSSEMGVIAVPTLQSEVLITFTGPASAYVAVASEITSFQVFSSNGKLQIKNGISLETPQGAKVELSQKVKIANNIADLGNVLAAILDELSLLTVTCTAPGTPSSPPVNAPKLQALKLQLQQLL